MAALRSFALVKREKITDDDDPRVQIEVIQLHPLVREVAAARRDGDAKSQLRRVLQKAVLSIYPESSTFRKPVLWNRCLLLSRHLVAIYDREAVFDIAPKVFRAFGIAGFQGERTLTPRSNHKSDSAI